MNFIELVNSSDNRRQKFVRDLFFVGCFTSLRYSDWQQIDREQIFIDDEFELLEILTTKTKQLVIIPLLPELENILKNITSNAL